MTWLRRLVSRDLLEQQLDAELQDHFDRLVADLVGRGHPPHEAARLARLEFGGVDQVKEACRDARGTRCIDEALQDIRYALRGVRREPGFTAVVVVTLALGVGANLSIFSVIDALFFRPLAVPNPAELVTLTRSPDRDTSEHFSYPQIRQLAQHPELFEVLSGVATDVVYVGGADTLQPAGAV